MSARNETSAGAARPDTLYERTATQLLELIAERGLGPGDRLPTERELAEMLGVSRVPVRDAIRTLAAQGLVEARRGKGTFVAARGMDAAVEQATADLRRDEDVFADLFAVRRLLEPAAAAWAAKRLGPADAKRLDAIVGEMEALDRAEKPDLYRMADLDTEFHVVVATAADNAVLLRLMEALQDLHREQLETSSRYRGRLTETIVDHRRIVEAILAGDPVGASLAMTDHLSRSEAAHFRRGRAK
jgi:GntR family transcriptional regulator, transcriptional repressor for pyruvate dehydrogenase complex